MCVCVCVGGLGGCGSISLLAAANSNESLILGLELKTSSISCCSHCKAATMTMRRAHTHIHTQGTKLSLHFSPHAEEEETQPEICSHFQPDTMVDSWVIDSGSSHNRKTPPTLRVAKLRMRSIKAESPTQPGGDIKFFFFFTCSRVQQHHLSWKQT